MPATEPVRQGTRVVAEPARRRNPLDGGASILGTFTPDTFAAGNAEVTSDMPHRRTSNGN